MLQTLKNNLTSYSKSKPTFSLKSHQPIARNTLLQTLWVSSLDHANQHVLGPKLLWLTMLYQYQMNVDVVFPSDSMYIHFDIPEWMEDHPPY
jgi:hypothetical protein